MDKICRLLSEIITCPLLSIKVSKLMQIPGGYVLNSQESIQKIPTTIQLPK